MSEAGRAHPYDRLEKADFQDWYRERDRRENARQGHFHRNVPTGDPPTDLHFPHTLLQCHRKRRYEEAGAPAETVPPHGRFWMGSRLESELVLPFLADRVAAPDESVTAGIGFEAPVETDAGRLRLRGRTDPVITTADGTVLLPTEVKTKRNVDGGITPGEHHLAQLHAYMQGLSATRDRPVSEAALVYVSRADLAVRTFRVTFDAAFWQERVLPWLRRQTTYRETGDLPPANPEQGWECDRCPFRNRCGEGRHPAGDVGPVGFLPNLQYPRAAVMDHLRAAPGTRLTPTLARTYPELAASHSVADWHCPVCGSRYEPLDVDSGPGTEEAPSCPACRASGDFVTLEGPSPAGSSTTS
ncbi:MAG: PD-(D/E)XK nuclease family protein [Halodesulfurarchaeum sp.]